jgi:RNA polymerase sigma-70 factor (ECF subfamily)
MVGTDGEWSEREAVTAAQSGDFRAFDGLVRRYRPGVVMVARQYLGSREAAEDVVQDAFVTAYKALPQLRTVELFPAWLGAIVRHRCLRARDGERAAPLPLDRLILRYAPSIVADIDLAQRRGAVRCAITCLPEEQRACVELHYLDEWPVRQIAAFLGLTVTTVKWRLHAARGRLRQVLEPHLADPSEKKNT